MVAYICGPLTELPEEVCEQAKCFYSQLADVCEEVMGERAFVPHEHYDPVAHASFTPQRLMQQSGNRFACAPTWSSLLPFSRAGRWH